MVIVLYCVVRVYTQPFVWRGSTRVLRRSFAGSRGSTYCLRGGEAMRGAGPCGPCAGPAGPTHVARGPRGASRVHSIRKRCGPVIVWRGSTLVHAGPRRSGRVYIIESCSLASCTTQPFVWRGSTRVPRREAVLFAWRRGHHRRGATRVLRSSCAVPAGPTQVTRPSRPCGSIPSGSDVSQLCGAGPRGS